MSNLAAATHLRQPVSQFPSHWYTDPRVFEAEMRTLFPRGPGYVGHELRSVRTTRCPAATTRRSSCGTRSASSSCRTSAATARR